MKRILTMTLLAIALSPIAGQEFSLEVGFGGFFDSVRSSSRLRLCESVGCTWKEILNLHLDAAQTWQNGLFESGIALGFQYRFLLERFAFPLGFNCRFNILDLWRYTYFTFSPGIETGALWKIENATMIFIQYSGRLLPYEGFTVEHEVWVGLRWVTGL
jgi:hypothetical protein